MPHTYLSVFPTKLAIDSQDLSEKPRGGGGRLPQETQIEKENPFYMYTNKITKIRKEHIKLHIVREMKL